MKAKKSKRIKQPDRQLYNIYYSCKVPLYQSLILNTRKGYINENLEITQKGIQHIIKDLMTEDDRFLDSIALTN